MQEMQALLLPIAAAMSLAFLYGSVLRYLRKTAHRSVALSIVFSAAIILAMTFPIRVNDGLIFDLRGIILAMAVLAGGRFAGAATLVFGASYRLMIGGDGAISGIVGLCLVYILADIWVRYINPLIKPSILTDALFGLWVSMSLGALFVLPAEIAMQMMMSFAPTITVGYVVSAMVLGYVFRRETLFENAMRELEQHAHIDPLTKLLNRRGTTEALKKVAFRSDKGRAMLYFDIDHFKDVNDKYGHELGDAVLAKIAELTRSSIREDAVLTRHGGDEFTAFIPNVDAEAVKSIAERLRTLIDSSAVSHQGAEVPISISIGVYWTASETSYETMLRRADDQLLASKREGRNRFSADFEGVKDPNPLAA